jgi:hypothetical protein
MKPTHLGFALIFFAIGAVAQNEPAWIPPLASGGAPQCPTREGVRRFRSKIVRQGTSDASIVGTSKRHGKQCGQSVELQLKQDDASRSYPMPEPGRQAFELIDFSPDQSTVLLSAERNWEYPNEAFRSTSIALLQTRDGSARWKNIWDIFDWKECDADVEPQGFDEQGRVVIRVRPSTFSVKRRPDCVPEVRLYAVEKSWDSVQQLPPETNIRRNGKAVRPSFQACKTDPDIVGACFSLRARLSAYNGNPTYRMWRVGTSRMLGVHNGIMPESVNDHMGWDVEAWGEFEVCSFSKEKEGKMQSVCIESAKNVHYQGR